MKYFALAMSVLYVLAGCAFLFTNAFLQLIPNYRLLIGLLLLGYGVVRAYLWRRKYADEANNE